jgi:hypothetical protein
MSFMSNFLRRLLPKPRNAESRQIEQEAAARKEADQKPASSSSTSPTYGYNGYVSPGSFDLAGPPPSGADDYSSHGM